VVIPVLQRKLNLIIALAGGIGGDHVWWAVQGSNLRPPACKAGALTG
jgi:hypothetical protein